MSQEIFSGLAIIATECELARQVIFDDIIESWKACLTV